MKTKHNLRKTLSAALIGNALEFYDFTLYGFFVAVISPLFFPTNDPFASLVLGFGVFAVGFLTRPLGALFFGHIGDKWGRKKALSTSILMMAAPTVFMGLLPTYSRIGIAAPLLLTLCRMIQGFCAGGEYNGAGVFVVEHSPKKRRGFLGGLLTSSGLVGSLAASGIGILFTLPFMPTWAWRIPFLLGAVVGVVGYYLRQKIEDTPDYKHIAAKHRITQVPLLDMLKNNKVSFMIAIGVGAMATTPFYILLSYMNPILMTSGKVIASTMMLMNAILSFTCIFTLPFMGFISDRIGHARLMLYGSLGIAAIAYPLFYVFNNASLGWVIAMQVIVMMLTEAFAGPSNAFLYKLFPPQYRYTGIALGYCLGLALFGGTAPLLVSKLIAWTGNPLSPSWYLALVGMVGGLISIYGHQHMVSLKLQNE